MSAARNVRMLTRYKSRANVLIYRMVSELPREEVLLQRKTRFGNMVHTLNHVFVIDSVFQAHLLGRPHGYAARNTPTHPTLEELQSSVQTLDKWYVDFVAGLSDAELERRIAFLFIGGGEGVMSCEEMM